MHLRKCAGPLQQVSCFKLLPIKLLPIKLLPIKRSECIIDGQRVTVSDVHVGAACHPEKERLALLMG